MAGKVQLPTTPMVLTANRLTDGHAVWLTAGNSWSDHIVDAALFPPADVPPALVAAQAAEAAQIIVAPYATEASATPHGPEPAVNRERIRAHGPTVLTSNVLAP